MRKVFCILILMLSIIVYAQNGNGIRAKRGNCMPNQTEAETQSVRLMSPKKLATPNTQWDANRTYRQLVILVAFQDRSFAEDHDVLFYDSLFNYPGFNKGAGAGCVADYFRDQSGGVLNMKFDVYGPVTVDSCAKKNGTYGGSTFRKATQLVINADAPDFSLYDWNGNGRVNQIIFIYAGYGGNESSDKVDGCIWPNTSSFSSLKVKTDLVASSYTASAELWSNDVSCGIGTICHEFSHSLGLPDLYPTSSASEEFSVLDEWDLMDGGNFTDDGWCPPNYSAHEKMLLGWLTPRDLSETAVIEGLKPVSEGGTAYIVRHTDNEFFLLENRQWEGWDYLIPGRGLLISHVDYLESAWTGNSVNNKANHHRYDLVHADNLNYTQWEDTISGSHYVHGHSKILSGSPYPFEGNDALTDTTTPAATTFTDVGLLSKPITHIKMTDDGLVSFQFMSPFAGIKDVVVNATPMAAYDLRGRQVPFADMQSGAIYIIRYSDGSAKKVCR